MNDDVQGHEPASRRCPPCVVHGLELLFNSGGKSERNYGVRVPMRVLVSEIPDAFSAQT